jgi:hypothetical protein
LATTPYVRCTHCWEQYPTMGVDTGKALHAVVMRCDDDAYKQHIIHLGVYHDFSDLVVNRTEPLDASRTAVREKKLVLPRQTPLIETFARHMCADAKILDEDEDTGAKRYRYIRSGEDHFSLAVTYALLAANDPKQAEWRHFWIGVRLGKWPAIQWL